MELRRQAQCVYRCLYHIVWIPRYRYAVLVNGVDRYLLMKLDEVRKQYPEIEYVERNVQPDHVHLVVSFPPRWSIAKVVQLMKAGTGRERAEEFLTVSSVPYRITVRAAPPGAMSRPRPEQRFREGSRIFRILAVAERGVDGRYLTCHAREEVSS